MKETSTENQNGEIIKQTQKIQIVELSYTDFKVTTVNTFKELNDNIQKNSKEPETIKKNQVKILVMKNKVIKNSHGMGGFIRI